MNIEYFETLLGRVRNQHGYIDASPSEVNKIHSAFEKAHDIRKFEIGLYWQRSAYLWGFISVLTAVCAYCFTKLLDPISYNQKAIIAFISLVTSLVGVVFSDMWVKLSSSSKYWQENWEYHINILEDYISGNLHKIHFHNNSKPYKRYSIHDIFNTIIRRVSVIWWFTSIISFFTFINSIAQGKITERIIKTTEMSQELFLAAYILLLAAIFVALALFYMSKEKQLKIKDKKEIVDDSSLTFTCDDFTCTKDMEQ
ncbi:MULTISPECIES: hypothetical protein [unclassified Enterobacter]|uniref:RipA family octameric membrane protein n=1 Tax=unclassified Enterobacter TaxID=2608935 RepID=UPI0011CDD4B0|nr:MULTISPECIES: hypothetical protein [unclassified Enterobacter]